MIRNHIVYSPFSDWQMQLSRAEGSFLWDANGKEYIDFTSGWNTANLGWNHPEIRDAVIGQMQKNAFVSMWMSDVIQEIYAGALLQAMPQGFDVVLRATGGTEANEQAIKIARAATGRSKIISFADTFHGETYAAISLGYRPAYVKKLLPMVPDFIQLEYPALHLTKTPAAELLAQFLVVLEKKLKSKDVAAVVTEAGLVTGWGSMYQAPAGFLKEVRTLTHQYGTLLILDEVGTGFSRCGKLFAMELEGVLPDIVTLAKAMTNGVSAMGACVTKEALVKDILGDLKLVSSLGWTPAACAAAHAVLKIHQRNRIPALAEEHGKWIRQLLTDTLQTHPRFLCITGSGMEIGLTFKPAAQNADYADFVKQIVQKCFEKGLYVFQSDETTIQIMPPLTTPQDVLKTGLEIFFTCINNIDE